MCGETQLFQYESIESLKKNVLDEISAFNEIEVKSAIQRQIAEIPIIGTNDRKKLHNRLYDAIFGYDIIQPLLDDTQITEIMINGLNHVFYEREGKLFKSQIKFDSHKHLMQLIHKIGTEVGREINIGNPISDARLKDGSRVNIVLDNVALNGPTVTIRKFKKALSTVEDLVQSGMFDHRLLALFDLLVKCKFNLFICGGTGSGKTTLLNCLCGLIDSNERIITIEDAAEITMPCHENVVTLETRKSHQGQQDIAMSRLIKNALRMRPDRIIVGEVRGEEVIDMLQAMNTGHDGSFSTGHSNSSIDMLTRLEVIASSYTQIHHLLIRKQIISAIDFIIFVEKTQDGSRKVITVSEINKKTDDYELMPIYDRNLDPKTPALSALKAMISTKHKLRRYTHETGPKHIQHPSHSI